MGVRITAEGVTCESTDCDQCPAAANVEVQLSLKFNETLVSETAVHSNE